MDEISTKQWIIAVLLVALIAFGAGNLTALKLQTKTSPATTKNSSDIKIQENDISDPNNNVLKEKDTIVVYVTGAVNNPDVYELSQDSRIKDAIEKAGGPTKEANLVAINLAKKISDGEEIIVPKKGEETANGAIPTSGENQNGKININIASITELEKLPGIGEVKADAIIQYRKKYGPFKTVHDIVRVSGIGEKTFEKLKELISVN